MIMFDKLKAKGIEVKDYLMANKLIAGVILAGILLFFILAVAL